MTSPTTASHDTPAAHAHANTRPANDSGAAAIEVLQPAGWPRPKGYANGMAATGRMVFVSGMIGWDADCVFQTDDFTGQVAQALRNIVAVLAEAQAGPEHIVRMTWYVKDKKTYVAAYPEIGKAYREIIGRHFPTMTAVQVADLIEDRAQVEIEVTAMVPETAHAKPGTV